MKAKWTVFVIVILAAALSVSAALISAQEATDEPSSFADNRINQEISTSMGGVAIYCVDQNGSAAGNTFQNGSIEVWGINGEKFIVLTVDQLRGNEEIVQPVVMPDASATMEATTEATEEAAPLATALPPATDEVTGAMLPVLLARAATPNGELWMYRVGEDTFAIQGTDTTGKFYTYTWAGCSLGSIATDTAPILSFETGPAAPEGTEEATAEATAAT
jgi:hypothetical protein